MRKTFFADVDEYESSGRLNIPPMPDPGPECGAGILPAPNLNTLPAPDPVIGHGALRPQPHPAAGEQLDSTCGSVSYTRMPQ
jgi:hypothetical protein